MERGGKNERSAGFRFVRIIMNCYELPSGRKMKTFKSEKENN